MNENLSPNQYGCYGVRVCKNGEWIEVVIDDFIPVGGSEPAFSKANGPELWVILLEKAWAKLHGSYLKIEAGHTREAIRDLTGAPFLFFETSEVEYEELWSKFKDADSRNFVMSISSHPDDERTKSMIESSYGIECAHAYTLIGVHEVALDYGGYVRLMKVRNPWGEGEWKGDWSDSSHLWTPKLKA